MDDSTPTESDPATLTEGTVVTRYFETDTERVLVFEREAERRAATPNSDAGSPRAVVAQNRAGYGMLKVRESIQGDERERYYGFDMALDHAAELLGVAPRDLPVPDEARDLGM